MVIFSTQQIKLAQESSRSFCIIDRGYLFVVLAKDVLLQTGLLFSAQTEACADRILIIYGFAMKSFQSTQQVVVHGTEAVLQSCTEGISLTSCQNAVTVMSPQKHQRSQGAGSPRIFFSKSCSFQAILRKISYLEHILGSGPPGVKTLLGPPDQTPGFTP